MDSKTSSPAEKKFLLIFRLCLMVWILVANAIIAVISFPYPWLIFISNIMMFTMAGSFKDRFISAELGGLVGLLLTAAAIILMAKLTPLIGTFASLMIALALVLFILIVLNPYAPKILNNVGFAYLTIAVMDPQGIIANFWTYMLCFVAGSLIFNLGALGIMAGLKKLMFGKKTA